MSFEAEFSETDLQDMGKTIDNNHFSQQTIIRGEWRQGVILLDGSNRKMSTV